MKNFKGYLTELGINQTAGMDMKDIERIYNSIKDELLTGLPKIVGNDRFIKISKFNPRDIAPRMLFLKYSKISEKEAKADSVAILNSDPILISITIGPEKVVAERSTGPRETKFRKLTAKHDKIAGKILDWFKKNKDAIAPPK